MQPSVMDTLRERGFVFQITETGLEDAAREQQLTVYCGFDPTASSLHVGNLMGVFMLAHFQRHGHRTVVVVGGGTGMIGDPSGRSSERNLQTREQVAANAEAIRKQLGKFLSFDGANAAVMVDNYEWLGKMNMIEFLRDIGKHFTVNAMLGKESVSARLEKEQGISYTEFSYMLLQATDFLRLFERYNCNVQVGGSDQWGNITAGIELIRRVTGGQAHGVTCPLITTSDGQKFGKSAGNAVWLDPELTSPYEMYQYWLNTDDRDVKRFLTYFTFLPLAEIEALEQEAHGDPGARIMQRRLAREFVGFVHGPETARAVEKASAFLFGGSEVADLDAGALEQVLRAIPTVKVTRSDLTEGFPIPRAAVSTSLVASNSQLRTLVQQGGFFINNQKCDDYGTALSPEQLLHGKAILLRSGKKKYAALVVVD